MKKKKQINKDFKKLKRKINAPFIWFNIISAFFFVLCVTFSILNMCIWKLPYFLSDSIGDLGVLCQVVTAIVSFVSSIIGIAISLQNDTCYGISFRKFNGLRKNYHYSIKGIILLAIAFIVLNLVSYMLNMMVACIGIAIIAVAFCIYISCTEIPIMTKNEKALMGIVKKQLLLKWKNPEEDSKEIKDVLKYLIAQEYNLQQSYELLSDKDDEYNKYLLLKLLDLQMDLAFELQNMEATQTRREIVDSLIENISDILYFNFDLTKVLGSQISEYKHLVTRVLFRTVELDEGKAKTTHLLSTRVFILNYAKYDEEKRDFLMQIALAMLSVSIASNEFEFIRAVKKEFSQNYYHLGEDNPISIIFALISLQFYYLSTSARNVSDDLKSNIQKFLDEDTIVERTKVTSWRNLYKTFSQKFSIDFSTYIKYFFLNEHNFDVPLYSNTAYFVVLDTEYALSWYISNLFNSHKFHDFDYNNLLLTQPDTSYQLKKIGDSVFNETQTAQLPNEFVNIVRFFLPKVDEFKWFEMFENKTHHFRKFIDGLHIQDLDEKTEKSKAIRNKELARKYKTELTSLIKKEWGYDSSISVQKEPIRCLHFLTEKTSDAINYDECIIDFFSFNIYQELRRKTPFSLIVKDKDFDKYIETLLKRKIVAVTKDMGYGLSYHLKDETLKTSYEKMFEKAKKIDSHIFYHSTVFIDAPFAFNFKIVDFKVTNLTQEQITEKVKEYQRADGQYIYGGAFLSREQIEKYISEQFVILSLCAKYKISTDIGYIEEINLYPDTKDDETNIEEE